MLTMKKVTVSEFRAKCNSIISRVQKTKMPVQITRFGEPIAEIVPFSATGRKDWIESMKGQVKIVGDILLPAIDPVDWEVLRD